MPNPPTPTIPPILNFFLALLTQNLHPIYNQQ
jgi:hypothetical protein